MTGGCKTASLRKFAGLFLSGCLLVLFLAVPAPAQSKVPQTAGVDNNKMGPYRALAQLAFNASEKGDHATAATLAKILERTWDKSEDYGGDMALSKTNKEAFDEIDKAMDQFVSLLVEHANSAPDPARVKATYNAYLEKLKLAD
jgi:predicted RNase H-like HicB family nuclease